ncbi:uncharacterized protein LOC114253701 [Monomorium pharaonis]|uniref:uncharacterized protein LOC114253701 n=1 Tax=Monomorium pharaonis TaxID=307658 RepID=UPI00063F8EA6|nr:uncharacterized protein LOC114253701 [Monomorium pharaonis]
MPQDMNILCCYSCQMYQVHIVKKARKWHCKLCNAKQSIRKIYFQGSGKDCRLHVQHLNSLKANDTSVFLYSKQEDSSDNYNATSTTQESDIDNPVKNKLAKYSHSPKKENLSDVEDLSSHNIHEVEDITNEKSVCNMINNDAEDLSSDNIHEVEDIMTNEKSLRNATNNDSCNFENIADDYTLKNEDIIDKEKLCSTNLDYSGIEDKCNLQDNDKSNKDYNVASIFETYSNLDEPLDI